MAVNLSAPAASQADLDALAARVTALEQGNQPAPAPAPTPSPTTPTFQEDFSALSLSNIYAGSKGKWMPASWWSPNNAGNAVGDGWMVNPFNPATPINGLFTTSNGVLSLGIQKTPSQYASACGNKPYVTAQIISEFTQVRGYFEGRLKAPRLQGTNLAFWLIPTSGPWPPEIDMAEIVNQGIASSPFACQTMHITDTQQQQAIQWAPGFDATQWHTYGVNWQSDNVTFYIDRKQTGQYPTPSIYTYPMAIVIGMQQGGDWSGPIPDNATLAPLLVDSVTVWKTRPF